MYSDIILFSLILLTMMYFFARAIWFLNHSVCFEFTNGIKIESRKQRDGTKKWVIKNTIDGHIVYSKKEKEFVFEPLPSSRTEEFIKDTRFDNFPQAYNKYKQIVRDTRNAK